MTSADRRFLSWLFVVFGPLFVFGGFLAAFTDPGAVLVYSGMGLFATGLLLRTRLPALVCGFVGVAVFIAQLAWLVGERQ